MRVNLVNGVVGELRGVCIQGLGETEEEESIQVEMGHLHPEVVMATVFLCARMNRKETATSDSLYAPFSQVIVIYMMETEETGVCVLLAPSKGEMDGNHHKVMVVSLNM